MLADSSLIEPLFSWEVLSVGVGVLTAAGFALLADEFKQFSAARVCFSVSAVWLFGKVVMWSIFTSAKFSIRAGLTALVCAAIGIGVVEIMRLTASREAVVARETELTQASAPLSSSPPVSGLLIREFTNRTPRELLAFYENVTPLQADALIAPFKGLWIKVEGEVLTVVDAGGGGTEVVLRDKRDMVSCRFEQKWRQALSRLSKRDAIETQGRISNGQSGTQLYLVDCELADSFPSTKTRPITVPQVGTVSPGVDSGTRAFEASASPISLGPTIRVTDRDGKAIVGVEVLVVKADGTHLKKVVSDDQGLTQIQDKISEPIILFCARENYHPYYKAGINVRGPLSIQMDASPNGGSIIIPDGTGYIPGLDGRLNPILDALGRTYLYPRTSPSKMVPHSQCRSL